MFPQNWEVSERIAVQFCHDTRDELTKIMSKRKHEIDVKLLLYAIQKTTNFENLLSRRFTGVTFTNELDAKLSPFLGLIGKCFVAHLKIYVDSIDASLAELLAKFVDDEKEYLKASRDETRILNSCPDLFLFYKKSMMQCCQLDRKEILLELTKIFQKYLREYALKVLINNLPKAEIQSLSSSVQSITRDLQKISTSGLIQNFSSLLKEGDLPKFTRMEQNQICCILITAEYCLETTMQLEVKLKEKIDPVLVDQIDLSQEQDSFHG